MPLDTKLTVWKRDASRLGLPLHSGGKQEHLPWGQALQGAKGLDLVPCVTLVRQSHSRHTPVSLCFIIQLQLRALVSERQISL